jgi:nitroreductase
MSSQEHYSDEYHTLSTVIRRRRTSKDYDGRPISVETIEALLEPAVWAPNHGLSEPWRFRVFLPEGIQRWMKFFQAELSEAETSAFEKIFEKLQKVASIIYVTYQLHPNETTNRENYAATAAVIQNILLLATSQHLQSYWSTSKIMTHGKTKEFLDIGVDEDFAGAIWLGHGENPPPKSRKFAREKTLWIK